VTGGIRPHPTANKDFRLPDYDAKEIEAKLHARLQEIEHTRANVTVRSDESDAELADYDQHPGDQGTETLEQELDESKAMILDEEKSSVEQALERLRQGKYGICVDCGKEIPAARLEAQPEAIRCVEDQRRYEAVHGHTTGPGPAV
jgi:RNA polymerase-binding transcription factor DksA